MTSRRCRAWSSSRCASSAPRSPGTPCSTPSTSRRRSDVAAVDDAEERARAGKAIRDLGHAFVGHYAPPELLDEITATLDQLATRLDAGEPRDRATVRSGEEWKRGVRHPARGWRATTTGRGPAGRVRGVSTSRSIATATRSKHGARCARPTRAHPDVRTAVSSLGCSTTCSGSCSTSSGSRRSRAS